MTKGETEDTMLEHIRDEMNRTGSFRTRSNTEDNKKGVFGNTNGDIDLSTSHIGGILGSGVAYEEFEIDHIEERVYRFTDPEKKRDQGGDDPPITLQGGR